MSSRLAASLGLDWLSPCLLSAEKVSWFFGINYDFLWQQIALGQLPRVVLVPGFTRLDSGSLEQWYEQLSPETRLLHKDKTRRQLIDRIPQLERFYTCWLPDYARALTAYAIKKGYLIRQPCMFCGEPNSDAHHPDYSEPLRIIWFCGRHHKLHHHRIWAAEKLIQQTGRPAQLELFPKCWLSPNPGPRSP
jgi:hypothetical protein